MKMTLTDDAREAEFIDLCISRYQQALTGQTLNSIPSQPTKLTKPPNPNHFSLVKATLLQNMSAVPAKWQDRRDKARFVACPLSGTCQKVSSNERDEVK